MKNPEKHPEKTLEQLYKIVEDQNEHVDEQIEIIRYMVIGIWICFILYLGAQLYNITYNNIL